jgi:hypothetical protein
MEQWQFVQTPQRYTSKDKHIFAYIQCPFVLHMIKDVLTYTSKVMHFIKWLNVTTYVCDTVGCQCNFDIASAFNQKCRYIWFVFFKKDQVNWILDDSLGSKNISRCKEYLIKVRTKVFIMRSLASQFELVTL